MLDFTQLIPQIKMLVREQARKGPDLARERALAGETLAALAPEWETTARRIAEARTSWLLATLVEPPDIAYPLPPRPASYTALATDGSQIAPDRHEVAFCYLLNAGMVVLRYGENPEARLASLPRLAAADDEMADGGGPANGKRLAIERMEFECEAMAELIEEAAGRSEEAIALLDMPLILWWLESGTDAYQKEVVGRFRRLLDTARERRVPLAGYVSDPGSRDVINALRISRCDKPAADCERYCREHAGALRRSAPCAGMEDITDAALFGAALRDGERTALFGSRSKILGHYGEEQQIRAFYLHVGAEVARIEIPRWVAEDAALLARTHALVYDQAQKGQGYPRALTEAHEKAVVRGADRAALFRMLEQELARSHVPTGVTRKALSKRTRSV